MSPQQSSLCDLSDTLTQATVSLLTVQLRWTLLTQATASSQQSSKDRHSLQCYSGPTNSAAKGDSLTQATGSPKQTTKGGHSNPGLSRMHICLLYRWSRLRSLGLAKHSFMKIGHEIISMIQVGQLSVTSKRMCTKHW